MQASTQTRKVKHQRPNLVTAPELNALIGELKAEMAQLKHQMSELSATVAGLQQPVLVQQSPRQALRWSAIKAVKDSLKGWHFNRGRQDHAGRQCQFSDAVPGYRQTTGY